MGEERKRAARKTERVQKRKRDSGRREGNVTRQGGDMEHRITVYRGDGGGVCVCVCLCGRGRDSCHVCICKCLLPSVCVCVCVCWGLGICHRVSDLDAAHRLHHIHSALLSGVEDGPVSDSFRRFPSQVPHLRFF